LVISHLFNLIFYKNIYIELSTLEMPNIHKYKIGTQQTLISLELVIRSPLISHRSLLGDLSMIMKSLTTILTFLSKSLVRLTSPRTSFGINNMIVFS